MENAPPLQQSHPPSQPDARWYRLALFLTGSASAAGEIVKAVVAAAPEEMAQLRSKERCKIWLLRQIRSRAAQWRRDHAGQSASTESSAFPSQVVALSEPARSAFVLFHIADCSVEDAAHLLELNLPAFAKALAQARRALAAETVFPEDALLPMHRPWDGDAPKVAKAVRAAQGNPALAAQIVADQHWHEAIEAVALPGELALLQWKESPKPGLRALIFQPAALAIALALVVVVGVLIYFAKTHMTDFSGKEIIIAFVEDEEVANGPEFEAIASTSVGKLDDWFVMKGFEGFRVPASLEKAKAIACRIRQHEGIHAAEVELEPQNARVLVFRAEDLKPRVPPGEYIFQQEDWAVAVISDEKSSCVVMFHGDTDDMPQFLKTMGE